MSLDYQLKLLQASILSISITDLIVLAPTMTQEQKDEYTKKSNSLKSGYPLDYLIGKLKFLDLDLLVNENILIPRPETESWIKYLMNNHFGNKDSLLVDVGTGTGVIGLSLSNYFKKVCLVDISKKALEVCQKNVELNNISNAVLFKSNLLSNKNLKKEIQGFGDWYLVANLPYVPSYDKLEAKKNKVNFEPEIAIYSGEDGLDLFKSLCIQLKANNIKLPIQAVFELDPRNINQAKSILKNNFKCNCKIWVDEYKRERLLLVDFTTVKN